MSPETPSTPESANLDPLMKLLPKNVAAMVASGAITMEEALAQLGYFKKRSGAKKPPDNIQVKIVADALLKNLRRQAKRAGVKNTHTMDLEQVKAVLENLK